MKSLKATKAGYPVGLLFSQHSLTAAVEQTQKQATLLAIEEINGVGGINGIPLAPFSMSIGPEPKDYQGAVQHMCDTNQANVIFGPHMSNSRKAVLPIVENKGALLFYPTLYEGFEYSSNCFYTGAAPNQNSFQLAKYVIENYGKRVLFIGSNYIYAHESNRIMQELFEQIGGEVLDSLYFPLNSSSEDFDYAIQRAEALAPDVIYSTVVGKDTTTFYEAYGRSKLQREITPIVSLATNESDISMMSADAAEGHISAAPYFESLASEKNQLFVQQYKQRFGDNSPITAGAESAYFQAHLFAIAARQSVDLTLESIVGNLGGATFDAPQGRVQIHSDNHHTYLWPRIAKVNHNRRFEIIDVASQAVCPEPYLIRYNFSNNKTNDYE
ncbi:transporter substrate-binding domain-containing protein [Marinomonas transparens]|uniref:Transporter substrate-binding domain-containing protein n=1 Tax=Marinomonas transparens TaxID=2795388 RepID=A0A934MYU3_9GAMM|nr:transporter substrate-binding domain-containing protein [Marinomonas transparens]MBJ7536830.1 transporter substrate-binding domain-containing protein [Marinomonas transparens]